MKKRSVILLHRYKFWIVQRASNDAQRVADITVFTDLTAGHIMGYTPGIAGIQPHINHYREKPGCQFNS